jgi:hypothetical protein
MVLKPTVCIPKQEILSQMKDLILLAKQRDSSPIKQKLSEIVPEYCPQINCLIPCDNTCQLINPKEQEKTKESPEEVYPKNRRRISVKTFSKEFFPKKFYYDDL